MEIDSVKVTCNFADFTIGEACKYIRYVKDNVPCADPLEEIKVTLSDDGKVDVDYKFHGKPFERIRRITGYLTGDVTSWNDAKRAEESERVKHNVGGKYG